MATQIQCPACETRYEVKAAFPPEGRKVRCAKCSHVWQAKPVGAAAAVAAPASTPAPQAAPKAPVPQAPPAPQAAPQAPAPAAPRAPTPPVAPQAPAPQAAPQAPAPQAPAPQAPPPPPQAVPAPPPVTQPAPPEPAPSGMPPAAQSDAEFGSVDLAAQVAQMNAETEMAPPPEPPESAKAKLGGLFSKIMGKKKGAAAEPPASESASSEAVPPPPEGSFTAAASADASFDAGFPEDEQSDAALADPALVAAAFGETPPKSGRKKPLPIVAIGWGILALIVLIVVSMFMFAPSTTVSMLPGAARVYSLFGMPVGASGLAFEGVRYGWTNDGSQTVLEVQGNVRNTSSASMAVPTVVIALRDEKGEEISEWTTEVGSAELTAGEEAPFLRQIPSPPSNVRSIKVRFANAN